MYAITVYMENWQDKRYSLVSKKKWASYEDARKNIENYIETIPEDSVLVEYYISEEEDNDED